LPIEREGIDFTIGKMRGWLRAEPLPRGEVVSKVWEYIKKHELQNPENRREILPDDKLEAVFGKKKVTMFEMNKYLTQHLTSPEVG